MFFQFHYRVLIFMLPCKPKQRCKINYACLGEQTGENYVAIIVKMLNVKSSLSYKNKQKQLYKTTT